MVEAKVVEEEEIFKADFEIVIGNGMGRFSTIREITKVQRFE